MKEEKEKKNMIIDGKEWVEYENENEKLEIFDDGTWQITTRYNPGKILEK